MSIISNNVYYLYIYVQYKFCTFFGIITFGYNFDNHKLTLSVIDVLYPLAFSILMSVLYKMGYDFVSDSVSPRFSIVLNLVFRLEGILGLMIVMLLPMLQLFHSRIIVRQVRGLREIHMKLVELNTLNLNYLSLLHQIARKCFINNSIVFTTIVCHIWMAFKAKHQLHFYNFIVSVPIIMLTLFQNLNYANICLLKFYFHLINQLLENEIKRAEIAHHNLPKSFVRLNIMCSLSDSIDKICDIYISVQSLLRMMNNLVRAQLLVILCLCYFAVIDQVK